MNPARPFFMAPCACTNCVWLAERLVRLERELVDTKCNLEEVTAYAGQQHEKVAEQARQLAFLTTGRSVHD